MGLRVKQLALRLLRLAAKWLCFSNPKPAPGQTCNICEKQPVIRYGNQWLCEDCAAEDFTDRAW